MPGGLDPNQVILRVERIDDALLAAGLDFAKLAAAFGTSAGEAVIRPVLDGFNRWRNARPAFAAFESEVADDLAGPGDTWVGRLVSRLGLAHHLPPAGDRWHFGLMRYRVQDVMDAAPHLSQRFAVPTVLESRMNEWFFPAPRHRGAGYAVDTEPALARPLVREILHARIAYEVGHLHRIGSLSGTAARPDLVLLRNTHLSRVRMVAGRPGYADMMRP